MASSKELKSYITEILKYNEFKSGEDAAGYANAVLMMVKAYSIVLSIEQTFAMNKMGRSLPIGEGNPESKN